MGHKTIILIGLLAFGLLTIWCVWRHYPDMNVSAGHAPTATLETRLVGGRVDLTGVLPDQSMKNQLIEKATAEYGQGNFIDNISIGGVNANAEWLSGATGMLKMANRLGSGGGISIKGNAATFSGQVISEDVRRQLISQAATTAGSIQIKDNLTVNGASLFPKFSASLNNGRITLDGIAPNRNAKEDILKQTTSLFGQANVVDSTRIAAAGEGLTFRSNWLNSITGLIGFFKRFEKQGEIAFDGQTVTINGIVATSEIKNKLIQDMTALMGTEIKINDQIKVIESSLNIEESRIQQELTSQLSGKTIEFDTNSDQITTAGSSILDQIIPILLKAPETQIEISGHTDDRGADKLNQELSLRRAIAVKRYLGARGVGEAGLSTNGYGASQPIEDNNTEQGRARNRRIEFRVVPMNKGK